jgi:DNA-directed RNA polymerase specialized sigma24 family protein
MTIHATGTVELWSQVVDQFIVSSARGLPPEDREDLRQDIFVSLVEAFGPSLEHCSKPYLSIIALAVLDNFRTERRARSASLTWAPIDVENQVPDVTAPNLDLGIDLKRALGCLPQGLHNVAVDLFFHDLSQQEVAAKYHRNQTWVAAAKKQIVSKIYSFLKEEPCR